MEQYNINLINLSNELTNGQGDGRISIDDVDKIFKLIESNNLITSNDRKTLKYISNNYKFSDSSKKYFIELYKTTNTSYYKIINKIKYDNKLLQLANSLTKKQGDGRISEDDIKQLHQEAYDGIGITDTELNTLKYIKNNYNFTEKAILYLNSHILN